MMVLFCLSLFCLTSQLPVDSEQQSSRQSFLSEIYVRRRFLIEYFVIPSSTATMCTVWAVFWVGYQPKSPVVTECWRWNFSNLQVNDRDVTSLHQLEAILHSNWESLHFLLVRQAEVSRDHFEIIVGSRVRNTIKKVVKSLRFAYFPPRKPIQLWLRERKLTWSLKKCETSK